MGFVAPGRRFRRKRPGTNAAVIEYVAQRNRAVPLDPLKVRRARTFKQPIESSSSILERLPHDILWEVFLLAGIDNGLPLTSKYFNDVLVAPKLTDEDAEEVTQNKWLFLKVLDHCMIQNKNQEVDSDWIERHEAVYNSYETRSDVMERFATFQLMFARDIYEEKYGIDIRVFRHRFMNDVALKIIRERYPGIPIYDENEMEFQIKNRQAFFQWHFKVMVEGMKKAQQAEGDASEFIILEEVKKQKNVKAIEVASNLPPPTQIPGSLYQRLTHSRALMIRRLVESCKCALESPTAFRKACFDQLLYEQFPEYADFKSLQQVYTFDEFKMLVECITRAESLSGDENNRLVPDFTRELLYTLAEDALLLCPIEDQERLRDLAWLTLQVEKPDLQQLLSNRSLETL